MCIAQKLILPALIVVVQGALAVKGFPAILSADTKGTNNLTQSDFYGLTFTGSTGFVASATWDLTQIPSTHDGQKPYFDLDGSNSLEGATFPIVDELSLSGVSEEDLTFELSNFFNTDLNHPQTLTVRFNEGAFGAGDVLRFGVDTDFLVQANPTPGSVFGAASVKFSAELEDGSTADSEFTIVSHLKSEAKVAFFPSVPFEAFNDFSWAKGQLNRNITRYTSTFGVGDPPDGHTGFLLDYRTACPTPVRLTVVGGDWNGDSHATKQGSASRPGTDAYEVFNGKLDPTGIMSYGSSPIELFLSGLNNAFKYSVVLFGNRGRQSHANRITKIELEGSAAFINKSSQGSEYDGPDDPTTLIAQGYNTETGYVARFAEIDPGPDGTIKMILSDGGSPNPPKHYLNALYLEATKAVGSVPLENPPPSASGLRASLDTVSSIRRPTFSWSPVDQASWYYLWLDKDDTTVERIWLQGTPEWAPNSDLTCGTYMWWIQTWNDHGIGPWSEPASMQIPCCERQGVELVHPKGPHVGNSVTYQWRPHACSTSYLLQINRDNEVWFKEVVNADSQEEVFSKVLMGHPLGSYSWWIQNSSPDGYSLWSEAASFSVGKTALLAPQEETKNPVALSWEKESIADATEVYIWINQENKTYWNRWIQISETSTEGLNQAYLLPVDLPSGDYTWWIQTWNKNGFGPWSESLSFSVAESDP